MIPRVNSAYVTPSTARADVWGPNKRSMPPIAEPDRRPATFASIAPENRRVGFSPGAAAMGPRARYTMARNR